MNQFFKGHIDDIRLYNKVLTDLEVAQLSGLSGAIRATRLNAYSLADFEQGVLKPAKFSNFWAVWGKNGNAYKEVVGNPVKSGFNTSDYVGVAHTFPSLPLPDTTDCDKSEYVLTSADGLVTDQHHIVRWKLLFTDDSIVKIENIVLDWMSFTYEIYWTQSQRGYWRVWKDGELIASADDVKTLPDSYVPKEGDFLHFKTGLYNKWNDPVIDHLSLYFDDIELYIGDDIRVQSVCPECNNSTILHQIAPIISTLQNE